MTDGGLHSLSLQAGPCPDPSPVYRVAGRPFSDEDVTVIAGVVAAGSELSRWQLAIRVCERMDWRRPTGAVKWRECRDLLERLERDGRLVLPPKRRTRPLGSRTWIPTTTAGEPGEPLIGSVGQVEPLAIEMLEGPADHRLFRELVGRYHYLGYRVPFGAHLRYWVYASTPLAGRRLVAAIQFSSPAWKLAPRDRWIGWDDPTRQRNLQRIVNNSRFLVLPWVRVRNLASRILSLVMRRLRADWRARFGVEPLLVETLVDATRHRGSCYRAANWLSLGETTGRGRMDRGHARHGHAPKRILVDPLVPEATKRLREEAFVDATKRTARLARRGGRRAPEISLMPDDARTSNESRAQ